MMNWIKRLFGRGDEEPDIVEFRGQLEKKLQQELEEKDKQLNEAEEGHKEASDIVRRLEAQERYLRYGRGRS